MPTEMDVRNCPTCAHPCLYASDELNGERYFSIGWEAEKQAYLAALAQAADWCPACQGEGEIIHHGPGSQQNDDGRYDTIEPCPVCKELRDALKPYTPAKAGE